MIFQKKTWASGDKPTIEDFNRLEAGIYEALTKSDTEGWDIKAGGCSIVEPSAGSDYEKTIQFDEAFSSTPSVSVIIGKGNNPQKSFVSLKAVSATEFTFVFHTTESWYSAVLGRYAWFKWIAIAPKST